MYFIYQKKHDSNISAEFTPKAENIGQILTNAMKAIETENKQVEGVLPKNFNRLEKSTLLELLRIMEQIPMDIEGDFLR